MHFSEKVHNFQRKRNPSFKAFFAEPQLDALSQSIHTGCETSLGLTGIPQKEFDAQFKMFICVTFFSKSNQIELSAMSAAQHHK